MTAGASVPCNHENIRRRPATLAQCMLLWRPNQSGDGARRAFGPSRSCCLLAARRGALAIQADRGGRKRGLEDFPARGFASKGLRLMVRELSDVVSFDAVFFSNRQILGEGAMFRAKTRASRLFSR